MSLYERVGGDVYFFGLVERFYDGVEGDPLLRPIYPQDLEQGKANLAEFPVQYWGGPRTTAFAGGIRACACATFPLRSVPGRARPGFIT